jgi:hypothetical protein
MSECCAVDIECTIEELRGYKILLWILAGSKMSILRFVFARSVMKQIAVIIESYYTYQLHTKFYATFNM